VKGIQFSLLAEGCRGYLSEQLIEKFDLRKACCPQTYGLGIKELWEVNAKEYQAGTVLHTVGWPLQNDTYGGGFVYHMDQNQVSLGFVIGLDYSNPYLNPYEEMQRYKTHPKIRALLKGGKRLAYGAKALNEGGWQQIPRCYVPGAMIIGCSAGFMNVPKIKGTHTAMKSGMLAADVLLGAETLNGEHQSFQKAIDKSWIKEELYPVRNVRPSFSKGLWRGLLSSAKQLYLGAGNRTMLNKPDHEMLQPAKSAKKIVYPSHDGEVTFDLMSSVYLSNTNHEEDQPSHLKVLSQDLYGEKNLKTYSHPETRYCPAGVYEIVDEKLQINAQNCLHCKCCDIKDPEQNIKWLPPLGGDGPRYPNL